MNLESRSSGILLHPTSLPGPNGSGDLGPAAYRFADFLAEAGQRWWQMLPICPIGAGHCPYQTVSTFAGNPLLIDLGGLVSPELLRPEEAADASRTSHAGDKVHYEEMIAFRESRLRRAFARFERRKDADEQKAFENFRQENRFWLEDYALFCALKASHRQTPWTEWSEDLRLRRPHALAAARKKLRRRVRYHQFLQFEFSNQWSRLRAHCANRGIGLIGDVPIFVGHDSADVWAHPELFWLGDDGRPTAVAGVPPDYFSKTGQLWGNALYRWDALRGSGYGWWIARMEAMLERFDVARVDHFIAMSRYWEIPAGAKTAVVGRWMPVPGDDFLEKLRGALGGLPLIAEDLGLVTPEVKALRDHFRLPGMRVLQFAFGSDDANEHLPRNYPERCVVYTGTHDNDTTAGWFAHVSPEERKRVLRLAHSQGGEIHWDLIRMAFESKARLAVVPMQDVLGLGSEARMNVPGTSRGNWRWRMTEEQLVRPELARRLRELARSSGR